MVAQRVSEPMPEKVSAASPVLRPLFRKVLLYILVIGLLGGSVMALYADWIWTRWTQSACREHFVADQNEEAIKKLRTAIRLDSNNHESLFLLVRGHRRTGDMTRALQLLNYLESLNADPERVDLERQILMVQSGRIRESSAELSSMLVNEKVDGSDVLQAFVLGYFANLRTNEAADLLKLWQQSTPNDPQAYFMNGYLLRSLGQLTRAIAEYRKGLEISPSNQLMRQRLAECLIENSQIPEARAELDLVKSQSPDAFGQFLLARCDYAEQDLSNAEMRLDDLLSVDPNHLQARTLRGRIRLDLGKSSQAVEDLQMAVDQEPTELLARGSLGRGLLREQRKEEADQHFEFVKRASQAQSDITRLVRQSITEPENVDIRFQIGQLVSQYISSDDGAKWMRTVLEVQPNHAEANDALANYYQLQGDIQQSLLYRSKSRGTSPQPQP